jgi:hypothetical protein
MNLKEKFEGVRGGDDALDTALRDFRSSIHAWSEAAYSRPRVAVGVECHRTWRLAASCALGCALAVGSVIGAVHERHHRQETARVAAAARASEHERLVAAEQQARTEDEDLLATVDSDVSREVPSALEPLAQLMVEDDAQVGKTSK